MANYWDFIDSNMFLIQSFFIIMILIFIWKIISLSLFRNSNIPSPKGNAILGHMLQLRNSKDVVRTFEEWSRTYGPIVEFRQLGIFGK